jgi:hypothetical protein
MSKGVRSTLPIGPGLESRGPSARLRAHRKAPPRTPLKKKIDPLVRNAEARS